MVHFVSGYVSCCFSPLLSGCFNFALQQPGLLGTFGWMLFWVFGKVQLMVKQDVAEIKWFVL